MSVPEHIETASFEAHMAASEHIAAALGIDKAAPGDVALALAHAYGEALGIVAMTGAGSSQLEALGQAAFCATQGMVARIQARLLTRDCEGSA